MTRSVKLRFILAFFLLSPAFLWGQEDADFPPDVKILLDHKIKELKKDIQKELNQVSLDKDKKIARGFREVDSLYALIITPTTGEKERTKAVKTLKKKVINCKCRTQADNILYDIYGTISLEDEDDLHRFYKMAKSCEEIECQVVALQEAGRLFLDAYYKSKEEKK